jgi:hypothetical protein
MDSGAVMPGNQLDSMIQFLNSIFPEHPHIYRTPDGKYLLWEDVANNMGNFLRWLGETGISRDVFGLFPYASSQDFWAVFDELARQGYRVKTDMDRFENQDWLSPHCPAHKGAFYPWVNGAVTIEDVAVYQSIQKPRGLVAENSDELCTALNELQIEIGNSPVVLKQIFGGGGYGISFFHTIEDAYQAVVSGGYTFEPHPYDPDRNQPVLVQEGVNIQTDELGEVGVSVQFNGQDITAVTRTLADAGHWQGNILLDSRSLQGAGINRQQFNRVLDMASNLLSTLELRGRGGIDFVIEDDTLQPCFLEINAGRTTGAHEAMSFRDIIGPENGVVGLHKYTIDPTHNLTVADVADRLWSNGDLFNFNQPAQFSHGLLPAICVGDHLTVLGCDRDPESLYRRFCQVNEIL